MFSCIRSLYFTLFFHQHSVYDKTCSVLNVFYKVRNVVFVGIWWILVLTHLTTTFCKKMEIKCNVLLAASHIVFCHISLSKQSEMLDSCSPPCLCSPWSHHSCYCRFHCSPLYFHLLLFLNGKNLEVRLWSTGTKKKCFKKENICKNVFSHWLLLVMILDSPPTVVLTLFCCECSTSSCSFSESH